MKGKSPTARTKEFMTVAGFDVAIVEKWNPHARKRQDLYGVFDIIAMKPGHGIFGVQVTSKSNMASRRKKIQDSPLALTWKASGGTIQLHGWYKTTSGRWAVLIEKL